MKENVPNVLMKIIVKDNNNKTSNFDDHQFFWFFSGISASIEC
jgi:hypothetical protein